MGWKILHSYQSPHVEVEQGYLMSHWGLTYCFREVNEDFVESCDVGLGEGAT